MKNIKYNIILTNDYEVFGDGTGDVDHVLIRPTEEMLAICDKFEIPMTLFFDVLEYRSFREAEDVGIFGAKYKAASKIEKQIKKAKRSGHDIQLHLHPQWIGAKPVSPDKWAINKEYWRLPFVPGGLGNYDDPESLIGLFFNGRRFLEDILKPIDPIYDCIAFRAGGYCIQPEKEVLTAMTETGFLIDSSVCPQRKSDKGYAMCDFKNAPHGKPYWKVNDSVTTPSHSGRLLEIPIFTCRRSRLSRLHTLSTKRGKDVLSIFKNILYPPVINFDFCKLSLQDMKQIMLSAMKRFEQYPGSVPIVITGHSKEYNGGSDFLDFLNWSRNIEQVQFTTYGKFLEEL